MTRARRADVVTAVLREFEADRLLALYNGIPDFLEPNPVALLGGVRSIGASALSIDASGECTLVADPDADLADSVGALLAGAARVAVLGLDGATGRVRSRLEEGSATLIEVDDTFFARTRSKTAEEVANARRAHGIAESGYALLRELATPGVAEYELIAEVDAQMAREGAEDNFMLMSSGPVGNPIGQPSGRTLEAGDVIGIELSPCVDGQFVQVCRTVVLGAATDERRGHYALLRDAFEAGLAAIRPGATVAEVVAAVDAPLIAAGFAEYCRPPYMRVRGHGLGISGTAPGGLSRDNEMLLEPGMLFVLHPNQHLPGSGYMLCGDTVLVTGDGAESLAGHAPELAELTR